jgi:hypothetical protein
MDPKRSEPLLPAHLSASCDGREAAWASSRQHANKASGAGSTASSRCRQRIWWSAIRAAAEAPPPGAGLRPNPPPAPPSDGRAAAHTARLTRDSGAGLLHTTSRTRGTISGSGDAGEDDEGIAGDFKRDVLEIMLAGTPDSNEAAVRLRTAFTVAENQGFVHPIFLVARAGRSGLRYDENAYIIAGSMIDGRSVLVEMLFMKADLRRGRLPQ